MGLEPRARVPTTAFKRSGRDAETTLVTFERCPYDATLISAEAFSGGSLMLTCERCGAAWEAHNSLIRRVIEPAWDEVQAAQAELRDDAASGAEAQPR
jgi:hypothetical protein